jgi:hypothetical protein
MRASMAFFAGAGTVIVAIAAGLGGGLLVSDIMSPHGTKTPSKLEQRAATQAQPSPQPNVPLGAPQSDGASGASQAPAPNLAATQAASTPATTAAPAPSGSPQPKTEQAKTAEQAKPTERAKPAEHVNTKNASPATAKADASGDGAKPASTAQQAAAQQQASHDQASGPDNAYAKARDADLKQLEAKKKAERHQRWATRRSQQRDQDQSQRDRDQDGRDVRRNGPDDDAGPREIIVRRDDSDRYGRGDFFGRPMRPDYDRRNSDRSAGFDFPRINLFGPD